MRRGTASDVRTPAAEPVDFIQVTNCLWFRLRVMSLRSQLYMDQDRESLCPRVRTKLACCVCSARPQKRRQVTAPCRRQQDVLSCRLWLTIQKLERLPGARPKQNGT